MAERTLALQPGYKQTELGPLPEEWEVVRLGDLATQLKAGGTPKRGVSAYWDGGQIPFVKIEDITRSSGQIITTQERITEEGVRNSSAWVIPENTVLLSMYASIGETAINQVPLATNQAIAAIIPDRSQVGEEYLYFALKYFGKRLSSYNIQTTQKNVNRGIVERFPVPLPPLPEQRAIAHVLRTVQRVREATEKVIAATRELKKSLIGHLFTYGPVPVEEAGQVPLKETGIGAVPEHWEVVELGEIIARGPQNGIYKPQSSYGEGIPIVRIDDFGNEGGITDFAPSRTQASGAEVEKYQLDPYDILVNRVNSLSHLGKTTMVGTFAEPVVFESNMMRFSVDTALAEREYTSRFLSSPTARKQMRDKAKRAVAQSSINQGDVKSIVIPLPPLPEQREIARILSAVDAKISAEENRKRSLETLFKTLLHYLMTGKLRVEAEPDGR